MVIRLLNPKKEHGQDEKIFVRIVQLSDAALVPPLKIIIAIGLRHGSFSKICKSVM